ncbi:hypothetical protein CHISP_2966 [Chitinispirillum alkaliphilum]|nr:hypothetical protein CHISP_2966 [Chitinispirillum alkaliphilum]
MLVFKNRDVAMKILKQSKGGALVAVVMVGFILNVAIAVVYFSVNSSIKRSGTRRVETTALNLAEAGKEHLYSLIRSDEISLVANSRIEVFTEVPFGDGSYNVSCSANTSTDSVWVTALGHLQNDAKAIHTVASLEPHIQFPFPNVRGAVTARSNINVRGNITIDGRDHDANGNLVGEGLYGVSTCGVMTTDGNPHVGGAGHEPYRANHISDDIRSEIVEEGAPVSEIFDSPEAFLGVPAGSLDQYRVSEYTTPFRGIYYISDDFVGPLHFEDSYGILIVHNSSKTAELQINTGNFTGIIITDRMARIAGEAEVLGAVVTLTDGEVSTFGTGTALIRYSSEVLANLNNYLDNLRRSVNEVSWRED